MFSERLKTLRTEMGLTQNQLAQELGLSNKTISVYEKGTSSPTLETLEKMASYFGVTIDFLIGYSNDRNPKVRQLSGALNLSLDAIRALIVLTDSKDNSNVLSSLLENSNFAKFMTFVAIYVKASSEDINKAVDETFAEFSLPIMNLPEQTKYELTLSAIKTRMTELLFKALDEVAAKEPPATE